MAHTATKLVKSEGMPSDTFSIGPGILEDESVIKKEEDDDAILQANGHEAAMPRQFNWMSALGLGFSITNSWIGYLVGHARQDGCKQRLTALGLSDRVALVKD